MHYRPGKLIVMWCSVGNFLFLCPLMQQIGLVQMTSMNSTPDNQSSSQSNMTIDMNAVRTKCIVCPFLYSLVTAFEASDRLMWFLCGHILQHQFLNQLPCNITPIHIKNESVCSTSKSLKDVFQGTVCPSDLGSGCSDVALGISWDYNWSGLYFQTSMKDVSANYWCTEL